MYSKRILNCERFRLQLMTKLAPVALIQKVDFCIRGAYSAEVVVYLALVLNHFCSEEIPRVFR